MLAAEVLPRAPLYALCWALLSVNSYAFGVRGQLAWRGAALLAALAWVFWHAIRRRPLPRLSVDAPLMACLVVAATSALFAPARSLALEGLVLWASLALLAYMLADLLLAGVRPALVVEALLLAAALVMAQGLAALAGEYARWWAVRVPGFPLTPAQPRLSVPPFYATHLAGFVALLLPCALLRLWRARSGWALLPWTLWLGAAAITLWATASRAGWGAAALAGGGTLLGLLWLDHVRVNPRIRLTTERRQLAVGRTQGSPGPRRPIGGANLTYHSTHKLLARPLRPLRLCGVILLQRAKTHARPLAVCALACALFLALTLPEFAGVARSRGGAAGLTGRPLFWQHAWGMFRQRPLLGWGLNSFTWSYARYEPAARSYLPGHAHNLPLALLAELGAAGALAWAALVGAGALATLRSWRTAPRREPLLLLGAAWGGFLLYALFDVAAYPLSLALAALTVALLAEGGCIQRGDVAETQVHREDARSTGFARLAALRASFSRLSAPFVQLRFVFCIALALLALAPVALAPLAAERVALKAVRAAAWRGDWASASAALRASGAAARYPDLAAYLAARAAPGAAPRLLDAYAVALLAAPGNTVLTLDATLRDPAAPDPGLPFDTLTNRQGEGAALLDAVTRSDAGWPLPWLLLGAARERDGDGAAALAAYRRALALDTANAATLACRRSALCRTQPVPAAPAPPQASFDALAALRGTADPQPWLGLAAAMLRQRRPDAARYALEAAAALDLDQSPGVRDRHTLLRAALLDAQGQRQAALDALRQLAPDACCYPLSPMAITAGFPRAPLPALQQLLLTPERVRLLQARARLLRLAGDNAAANADEAQANTLAAALHINIAAATDSLRTRVQPFGYSWPYSWTACIRGRIRGRPGEEPCTS